MRHRSGLALLGVTALAAVGLVAPAAPASGSTTVDPPGIANFTNSGPARCTLTVPNRQPSTYDDTIGASGDHPVTVTVGEAVTVNFTGYRIPEAFPQFSFDSASVRVDGPVTPNGDGFAPAGMFKATGTGAVTITLLSTHSYAPRTPYGLISLDCVAVTPIVLTTFTPTTKPVCFGLPATIVGTTGTDVLHGTSGPDVIVARDGDDTIYGNGGDDTICGDHGSDHINAGDGNDRVDGGYANDVVNGQAGDDLLLGGSGDDRLTGGSGTDSLNGGIGVNSCSGELGSYCG
jgi:Ca2+-binding RTX toxin-like protein